MNLEQKHKESELRRLDGEKPTRDQVESIVRRTRYNITYMESARVLDDIAQSMMPATGDAKKFFMSVCVVHGMDII